MTHRVSWWSRRPLADMSGEELDALEDVHQLRVEGSSKFCVFCSQLTGIPVGYPCRVLLAARKRREELRT